MRIAAKIKNWCKKCQEVTIEIGSIVKDIIRTKDDPNATDKERDYSWAICYIVANYIASFIGYVIGYYLLGGEKRLYKRLKKKYNK